MTIAFGEHVETIPISSILKCVEHNIFGNKNFVIYHSGKTNIFLLNGLKEEYISEMLKLLACVEIKKAGILETLSYVVKPPQNEFDQTNVQRCHDKKVKNIILITIVFIGIALLFCFVSHYIASYYEKLGRKAPRWVYYCLIAVICLAYAKFNEAFSNGKDNK
ncbi:MAG: hypothetical protein M0T70_02600 [Geobacteraceae bacterium]|nr:hypothetical protein [Geobacteraceae bacterium]